MKMMGRKGWILLALAVQCAGLGWLIGRYERVVTGGTEVRFACSAYDPYDPFRGRYLQTRVVAVCADVPPSMTNESWIVSRKDLFVQVDPTGGTNGFARVVRVAEQPSAEGLWVKPKRVDIESTIGSQEKGKDETWDDFYKRRRLAPKKASVHFPDQFFVNEKIAREAEICLRRTNSVPVAVYRIRGGACVLTGIEIDGRPIADHVRAAHAEAARKK